MQLAEGRPTTAYVGYFMRYVKAVQACGVEPIIVFDGRRPDMKAVVEVSRRTRRQDALRQGLLVLNQARRAPEGSETRQKLWNKATDILSKSVRVTDDIVETTMKALRAAGVTFVVAPCEADAQLAYMVSAGVADAIITEDSDIVVFLTALQTPGVVLYKLQENGHCLALTLGSRGIAGLADLPSIAAMDDAKRKAFIVNLAKYTPRMFVQTCVLAGCDYLNSVYGQGLRKIQQLVLKFRTVEDDRRLERMIVHLRRNVPRKVTIAAEYRLDAVKAELCFLHQVRCLFCLSCNVQFLNVLCGWCGPDGVRRQSPSVGDPDAVARDAADRVTAGRCSHASGRCRTATQRQCARGWTASGVAGR